MIEETPGAGPDETAAPESAPDTTTPPAGGEPAAPEPPAAADPVEPPVAEPADEPEPEPQPLVHGADQVAQQVEDDQAQGFHGQEVDETPNAEYAAPNPPADAEGTDAA